MNNISIGMAIGLISVSFGVALAQEEKTEHYGAMIQLSDDKRAQLSHRLSAELTRARGASGAPAMAAVVMIKGEIIGAAAEGLRALG